MRNIFRWIFPIISIFAIIIVIFLIHSNRTTTDDSENINGQAYFNATVVSISDDKITVMCCDMLESNFNEGEQIVFSPNIVSVNGVPELSIGDEIRIVYNKNNVEEGNPVQLKIVFSIYKLDVK